MGPQIPQKQPSIGLNPTPLAATMAVQRKPPLAPGHRDIQTFRQAGCLQGIRLLF